MSIACRVIHLEMRCLLTAHGPGGQAGPGTEISRILVQATPHECGAVPAIVTVISAENRSPVQEKCNRLTLHCLQAVAERRRRRQRRDELADEIPFGLMLAELRRIHEAP